MNAFAMMAALFVGHALCDYPLQGPFLSEAKSRVRPVSGFPWWQAMSAHCVIHGGAVAFLTGVWWLGVAEAVAHFAIDDLKCRNRLSVNQDQALHIGLKAVWVAVAMLVIQ